MAHTLPKNDRRQIQLAFREIIGNRLTSTQKEVVRKHGLEYGLDASNHPYLGYGRDRVHLNQNNHHGNGRIVASQLISLVERKYNSVPLAPASSPARQYQIHS